MIKQLHVLSQAGLFLSCQDVPVNFHNEDTQKNILATAKRLGVVVEVKVASVASTMDVMASFLKSRQYPCRVSPGDVLVIATNDPMEPAHDSMATTRFVAEIESVFTRSFERNESELDSVFSEGS
jgi:hypothetical protein